MCSPMNPPVQDKSRRRQVILIVDDDAVVTRSLSALLELETDYRVLTYQSPHEALRSVEDAPVDLVISDFLMPDMNGLEFLLKFKRRYPDVPRIMLTGYADKENSIRAINEVGLFQYIEKPWDNDQMKLVIESALTTRNLRVQLSERIHDLDVALRERETIAARHDVLREELQLARRMQRGMLPESLPSNPRYAFSVEYHPALEIGGDFYDVIPLSEGRTGVLVADVTGHGIQAALSTAVLKFAFSDFKNCDCAPGDIVLGMNHVLLRALPEETFAAAMVVILDPRTDECRLVNAGLPHPFLLHRESTRVERVVANGFMLGVLDEDLFQVDEAQHIRLAPGDFLAIYTDGISEVPNKTGELFDQSALREHLLAHADSPGDALTRTLVSASRAFGASRHEWDDITVLGIDVT